MPSYCVEDRGLTPYSEGTDPGSGGVSADEGRTSDCEVSPGEEEASDLGEVATVEAPDQNGVSTPVEVCCEDGDLSVEVPDIGAEAPSV